MSSAVHPITDVGQYNRSQTERRTAFAFLPKWPDQYGLYMVGALSFSPILKIGPYPTHPVPPGFNARSRAGHRGSTLGSGQDVAHVARIPAATARCRDASVVESVSDLLQRGRACLLHLLYDRQHRACEALGLSLTSLTTAAADGI